ncbi:hypothetical protein JCM19274_1688 [Algibacter lectus]|uniref:Uncharacterized protein n=1 Tax=Algibacter lectus TaxID=221126 RepID=A0A090WWX2_9FLAO|nr:hypothetical protein JCM19274_1688 [Algibacter lectus]
MIIEGINAFKFSASFFAQTITETGSFLEDGFLFSEKQNFQK